MSMAYDLRGKFGVEALQNLRMCPRGTVREKLMRPGRQETCWCVGDREDGSCSWKSLGTGTGGFLFAANRIPSATRVP